MSAKHTVFLALPQGGTVHPGSIKGAFRASRWHKVHIYEQPCSILTFAFNLCWAACLNQRASHSLTHFAMLHGDIEPEERWLDVLLEELEQHNADVVSAIVPIKDQSGILSCGIADPANPYTAHFRLTLKQAYSLPETFDAADCGYSDRALLVNSGCWVMRLDRPWVEELCFSMTDRITKGPDGQFRAEVEPEDWKLSRWLYERGARAMCTRRVGVAHHGAAAYPNFPAWGEERDGAAVGRLRPK